MRGGPLVAKGVRWTDDDLAAAMKRMGIKQAPMGKATTRAAKELRKAVDADIVRKLAEPHDKVSVHVQRFEQQLAAAVWCPPFVREYYAIPGRNFRLDYAWVQLKVGVEIQGVHHREKGKFGRDIEKRALHLLAGWRVLELDGKAIKEERSVEWLKALLHGA